MRQTPDSQGAAIMKKKSVRPTVRISNLPLALVENKFQYSVVLNLWGTKEEDIFIDVNFKKSEFGVYAGKKTNLGKNVDFWIFCVPSDGILRGISAIYKDGGLQVTIPRIMDSHLIIKQGEYRITAAA